MSYNTLFCLFVCADESCDKEEEVTVGPRLPDACTSNPCPPYLECEANGVEFSCVCPENSIHCGGKIDAML